MPDTTKDRWEKLEICIKFLGLFMTPVLAALFGYLVSDYLKSKEEIDARSRLYTEMTARREEVDTSLRKGMLDSINNNFIDHRTSNLKSKILCLELLAFNFGDSLDLGPLFEDIHGQIPPTDLVLKDRVISLIEKIKERQINILEGAGYKREGAVDFDDMVNYSNGIELIREELPGVDDKIEDALALRKRNFTLTVIGKEEKKKRLNIRLIVSREENQEIVNEVDREFWVGLFDFPLIENIRLPGGQRCAVLLNEYADISAQLALLYFPGERASIKDKPYTDEIMDKLKKRNGFSQNPTRSN